MSECKDCAAEGITTRRPAPHPGPRCSTHHRLVKRQRAKAAHEKRVQSTYGLEPGDYDLLYEAQGGRCAICLWARGLAKRLALDHDHSLEHLGRGAARGLLCSSCNIMLGRARDDPAFFQRAIDYLADPPARRLFGA